MDCQEELSMAESKELIHYQNELFRVYDQLDFSKEPNFQECRNVIISTPLYFMTNCRVNTVTCF